MKTSMKGALMMRSCVASGLRLAILVGFTLVCASVVDSTSAAEVAGLDVGGFLSLDAQYRKNAGRNMRFGFAPGGANGSTHYSDLSMAELSVSKTFSKRLSVRTDLDFAFTSGAAGAASIGQAFGTYQLQSVPELSLMAGWFYAPLGYDPVTPDQMKTVTPGLVFSSTVPGSLMGLMATFNMDLWRASLLFANGWDNSTDTNDGKTFGFQLGFDHSKVDATLTFLTGPEGADNSAFRTLVDLIANLKMLPMVTVSAEANLRLDKPGTQDYKQLYGMLGVVDFQPRENAGVLVRAEWIHDGNRAFNVTALPGGANSNYGVLTFAPYVFYNKNFHLKAEYRADFKKFTEHMVGMNATIIL